MTLSTTQFAISKAVSCDLPSIWKSSAQNERSAIECQTDVIEHKDVKIQVVKRANVEVQTDRREQLSLHDPSTPKHYDKPSLYAFLKRATPIMIKQLERNSQSTAFRHFQQQQRRHHLEQLNVLTYREKNDEFAALCVSVNNINEDEIAVGFGNLYHSDWCDHQANLAIFRRREPSSRPNIFDMDSCVSCITYNDRKHILTCGMYTGEVVCWDAEEQLQVGGRHSGRVSSLQWRPLYERKRLLSAAIDGIIKIWKIRDKALVTSEEFVVTSWDADIKLTSRAETPIGITSTGFSSFDDSQFVIGTEGGYVMLGSLTVSHGVFENELKKCVTMSFKRHQGHVMSTFFSAHSRNVFLTSSLDKKARVYSQLQPSPVISVVNSDQLIKALWSPARQLHIVTASSSGHVAFYDLRTVYSPLAEIHLGRKITDVAFVGLDKVIVSTTNGNIHLLQMSEGLLANVDLVNLDTVVNSLQDGIGFE